MKHSRTLLPLALAFLMAANAGPGRAAGPEWLAGDFHVHTTYSHDSWDPVSDDNTGPDEFYVLGHSVTNQFAIAASRGLDFLAITDHNDIRAQSDPGFGFGGVIPIHAYENSLSGHAQMLGATTIYDNGDKSAATVAALADQVRADGGYFQVNHPAGESVNWPHDADWGYDYDVVPDSVEVWNIQSIWQPPAPSSNSNDSAIAYWEGWLRRGHHVGITGGSDNHWVSTTAAQGVGQPTTWVYANGPTESDILAAVAAGRTTISWQPPSSEGPRLFLQADADGDGIFESMVGDTVPDGSSVRVLAENLPADAIVGVHTASGAFDLFTAEPSATISLPAGAGWVWVDLLAPDGQSLPGAPLAPCDESIGDQTTYCRDRLVRLAMTSALYFE
ncbi:MAG TPA: CehA/McbA family metallohydrolase [Actinomycetota bacterium]